MTLENHSPQKINRLILYATTQGNFSLFLIVIFYHTHYGRTQFFTFKIIQPLPIKKSFVIHRKRLKTTFSQFNKR